MCSSLMDDLAFIANPERVWRSFESQGVAGQEELQFGHGADGVPTVTLPLANWQLLMNENRDMTHQLMVFLLATCSVAG